MTKAETPKQPKIKTSPVVKDLGIRPPGEKTPFSYFMSGLANYSLKGRSKPAEFKGFFYFFIVIWLIPAVLNGLSLWFMSQTSFVDYIYSVEASGVLPENQVGVPDSYFIISQALAAIAPMAGFFALFLLPAFFCITVRRLHDIGKSAKPLLSWLGIAVGAYGLANFLYVYTFNRATFENLYSSVSIGNIAITLLGVVALAIFVIIIVICFRQKSSDLGAVYDYELPEYNWKSVFLKFGNAMLSFIVPALLLLFAYLMFWNKYGTTRKEGSWSILALDLNAQYIYYYEYLKDALLGRESLFYSWSRNSSGEFLGIFGYYLASPFNLIVMMFPRDLILEGMAFMFVVKVGAIGLFMSLYLTKKRGYGSTPAFLFSLMYALNAYVITNTMDPMWLDGVMILPFVAWGVEALLEKGKFKMLVISLVYAFTTEFYIGYMIAIFTVIYYIYYYFHGKIDRGVLNTLKKTALFGTSALLSGAISAFIILPVYAGLSNGKTSFSSQDATKLLLSGDFKGLNQYFITEWNILRPFVKLLPNSYDTVRMEGKPFLYCGMITLVLTVAYLMGANNKSRKFVSALFITAVIFGSMFIKVFDMLWHGGQMPNWIPYRFSFCLIFLMCTWSAELLHKIDIISKRKIWNAAWVIGGLIIAFESFKGTGPFKTIETYNDSDHEMADLMTVLLPALLMTFVAAGLILYYRKNDWKTGASLVLGIVVASEMGINSWQSIVKADKDITYSSRASYIPYVPTVREKADEIKKADPGFYRIEKDFNRSACDDIGMGLYGFTHSSSLLNKSAIDILSHFGITSSSHRSDYKGATDIFDDIFGIRYIMYENTKGNYANEYRNIDNVDDISVQKNDDAFPMFYLVNTKINEIKIREKTSRDDPTDPLNFQNQVISAMRGTDSIEDYYTRVPESNVSEPELKNCEYSEFGEDYIGYKKIEKTADTTVRFTITASSSEEIYLWLPCPNRGYARNVNVWVKREGKDQVFLGKEGDNDNYHPVALGSFEPGEEFTLILTLLQDDVYFKEFQLYTLDSKKYEYALNAINEMNVRTEINAKSTTNFEINTNYSEDSVLFTSIPVERGWTVKIDGKTVARGKTTSEKITLDDPNNTKITVTDYDYDTLFDEENSPNTSITGDKNDTGAFISVNVPAGKHTITLTYKPAFYPYSVIFSLGGLGAFLFLCVKLKPSGKKDDDPLDLTEKPDNSDKENDKYEDNDDDGELVYDLDDEGENIVDDDENITDINENQDDTDILHNDEDEGEELDFEENFEDNEEEEPGEDEKKNQR